MAKPLDEMLTRYVTPILRPQGFRKTGRTYRLRAANGSQALINFQFHAIAVTQTGFFVNIDVVVPAMRDWMHDQRSYGAKPSLPTVGDGFWRDRVWPPEDVEYRFSEYRSQIWCFDDAAGAERCGRHLARVLTEETVPLLKRMLDRREQLAVLHDPDTPPQQLHVGRNHFGEILLRLDDGPSAELDVALADAERQGDEDLASWARQRLASRHGLDLQTPNK